MGQSPEQRRKEKVTWMEKAQIQLLIRIQTQGIVRMAAKHSKYTTCQYFLFRTEQGNHLVSILCGLVGAIVLVFLVIIVTMKVNKGLYWKEVHLFWT